MCNILLIAINERIQAMKNFYLVSLTLLSFGLISDVTVAEMTNIDTRVGSMSLSELQDRRSFLLRE